MLSLPSAGLDQTAVAAGAVVLIRTDHRDLSKYLGGLRYVVLGATSCTAVVASIPLGAVSISVAAIEHKLPAIRLGR
jgi:hypothetical protein